MKEKNFKKKIMNYHEQIKCLKSVRELLKEEKKQFALKEIKKLKNKYPKNIIIELEYAKLLQINEFDDEALSILNNIEQYYLYKLPDPEKFTLYNKIFTIYFLKNDYKEALKYYSKVLKYSKSVNFSVIEFRIYLLYILKELGITPNYNKQNLRYSEKQLIDYSLEEAIKHIKYHTNDLNEFQNESLFYDSIDIKKLINIVRENLKFSKPVKNSYIMDVYQFKYNDIGSLNGNPRNVLEVIAISKTDKVVTMYPTEKAIGRIEYLNKNIKDSDNLEPLQLKKI